MARSQDANRSLVRSQIVVMSSELPRVSNWTNAVMKSALASDVISQVRGQALSPVGARAAIVVSMNWHICLAQAVRSAFVAQFIISVDGGPIS